MCDSQTKGSQFPTVAVVNAQAIPSPESPRSTRGFFVTYPWSSQLRNGKEETGR